MKNPCEDVEEDEDHRGACILEELLGFIAIVLKLRI
jgi:hypothetical protein